MVLGGTEGILTAIHETSYHSLVPRPNVTQLWYVVTWTVVQRHIWADLPASTVAPVCVSVCVCVCVCMCVCVCVCVCMLYVLVVCATHTHTHAWLVSLCALERLSMSPRNVMNS